MPWMDRGGRGGSNAPSFISIGCTVAKIWSLLLCLYLIGEMKRIAAAGPWWGMLSGFMREGGQGIIPVVLFV